MKTLILLSTLCFFSFGQDELSSRRLGLKYGKYKNQNITSLQYKYEDAMGGGLFSSMLFDAELGITDGDLTNKMRDFVSDVDAGLSLFLMAGKIGFERSIFPEGMVRDNSFSIGLGTFASNYFNDVGDDSSMKIFIGAKTGGFRVIKEYSNGDVETEDFNSQNYNATGLSIGLGETHKKYSWSLNTDIRSLKDNERELNAFGIPQDLRRVGRLTTLELDMIYKFKNNIYTGLEAIFDRVKKFESVQDNNLNLTGRKLVSIKIGYIL